jgi:hypothetical protein
MKLSRGQGAEKPVLLDILFRNGKPLCRCCGAPIIDNGQDHAAGFRNTQSEVGGIGSPAAPRYVHPGGNAQKKCPAFFLEQPAFAHFKRHSFDFRVRERNRDILTSAAIRDANDIVLQKLMFALKQRTLERGELRDRHAAAMDRFSSMELLGENPWAMPYLLARVEGQHQRPSGNGRMLTFAFVSRGERKLAFVKASEQKTVETMPAMMHLCFFSRKRGATEVVNPQTGQPVRFAVSEKASHELVAERREFLASRHAMRPHWSEPQGVADGPGFTG